MINRKHRNVDFVCYNIVLSALGVLNPITGALWHNCGSVFLVFNAALLLRLKDTDSAN